MKQRIILFLLMMVATTAALEAYDFEVDGVYYSKRSGNQNEVMVTYKDNTYNSYSGNVVLPPTVTYDGVTYKVTEISAFAFQNCVDLITIDIQSPITTIGRKAFSGCTSLRDFELPKTLKTTGHTVFEKCYSLTTMTIPDSVTTVGANLFWNCTNLKSIHIGKSLSSIGGSTLSSCDSLSTITVDPENTTFDSRDNCNAIVETATNTLFLGCKTTVIPNTIETIGSRAMYYTKGIKTMNIPNSVVTICDEALSGMDVHSLVIPNSVVTIGEDAFGGCVDLEQLTIGSSVTSISSMGFRSISFLRRIYCLAECPPQIADDTFDDSFYTNPVLYVPQSSIDSYQQSRYWNRFQIEAIESAYSFCVDGVNYRIEGDYAFVTNWVENRYAGDIVIPSRVTYDGINYYVIGIDSRAFYDCYELKSIVMGNTINQIGSYAFEKCINLKHVDFGSGLSFIDEYAFLGCESLEQVVLPVTTVNINDGAFDGCKGITLLQLPEELYFIGSAAFRGCESLTELFIPASVRVIEQNAFSSCINLASMIVDEDNPEFDSRENCNAIISTASNTLIAGCMNTVIPESVTAIGKWAFRGCKNLSSIIIPHSITSIPDYAFYECVSLAKVKMPENLTTYGTSSFGRCSSLQMVDIPATVTQMGNYTFSQCPNVTRVVSHAAVPPAKKRESFFDSQSFTVATLFVPNESVEAYRAHAEWGRFTRIVPFLGAGPGDMNGDGSINISDVTIIINMISTGAADDLPAYCDMNGDGAVNISDVTNLISVIVNGQ